MEAEALEAATRAARLGGEILLDWRSRFTVSEKSRANLVTEADFASQEAIHGVLADAFPGHAFLGEEGLSRAGEAGCEYRWIVDPLDGTSNYVHGFPYFCVSIGLERNGKPWLGVIYDPTRDETFRAVVGGDATVNDMTITPSSVDGLAESMVVASLPVATDATNPAVERFLKVLPRAQSLQRTGSAALNLAYVACGRIEGFWSSSLKPWDMAAGVAIVLAAGGAVTRMDGGPFDVETPDLLATNGSDLHAELVQALTFVD